MSESVSLVCLRADMTPERACEELAREGGSALGDRQPVTVKEMVAGVRPDVFADHAVQREEPRVRVQLRVQPATKSVCFQISTTHVRRSVQTARSHDGGHPHACPPQSTP